MARLMAEMSQLCLKPPRPVGAPARGKPVGAEGGRGPADSTVLTGVGEVWGAAVPTKTVELGPGVAARGVAVRGVVVRVVACGVCGVAEADGCVAVALTVGEAMAVGVRVLVVVGVAVRVAVGVAVSVAVAMGVAV